MEERTYSEAQVKEIVKAINASASARLQQLELRLTADLDRLLSKLTNERES